MMLGVAVTIGSKVMDLDALVTQIEREIQIISVQHPQTRKKKLKQLRDIKDVTYTQKHLYTAVVDGVEHLLADAKIQNERKTRFGTIPKFFPSPDVSNDLDCLIYSRFIMGYTFMLSGNHGRRFKAALSKFKTQARYVEYLQSQANMNSLGQKNFHHLCKVGCPQATHEWLFVNDMPPQLIHDKSVILKSENLLKHYGY
jgi:hypothetical protein